MQTCLIEWSKARAVATNAPDFTQCLLKRGAQRDRSILCGQGKDQGVDPCTDDGLTYQLCGGRLYEGRLLLAG